MTAQFNMTANLDQCAGWVSDDGRHAVIHGDFHRLARDPHAHDFVKLSSVDHIICDWPAAPEDWTAEQVLEYVLTTYQTADLFCKRDASFIAIPRDRRTTYFSKSAIAGYAATRQDAGGWQLWREFVWHKREADFNRSAPAFSNVFAFVRGGMTSTKQSEARYKDIVKVLEPGGARPDGKLVDAIPRGVFSNFIPLFAREDDLMLDPFAGSGASAIVGIELGLRTVSIDIDLTQVERIIERIETKLAGGTVDLV